jgi:ribose-phosphate pyrophosphokinase
MDKRSTIYQNIAMISSLDQMHDIRQQRPFKIFSGSSNTPLAQRIANHLGMPLGQALTTTFSDGEIRCEIRENVRGHDVYVIQSTHNPCNTNIMELLIMGDALKRASVRSACAVIPYYGYARQDRKAAPRTPISAKLVADLLTVAGYRRLISVDLHAGQIQGFFDFPVDHLFSMSVLYPHLQKAYGSQDVTVVSPDAGGMERARIMAKYLNVPLAMVDKRRSGPNEAKAMNLVGDVKGRVAIIVDDMVDTAGTLVQAIEFLKKSGATKVVAAFTHGVFSGPAYDRLKDSPIDEIVVTDTIPLNDSFKSLRNLTTITLGPLIAETISRIQRNDSVSALLDT